MSHQSNVEDFRLSQAGGSNLKISTQSGQLLELNNVQLSQYFSTFVLMSDCCNMVYHIFQFYCFLEVIWCLLS